MEEIVKSGLTAGAWEGDSAESGAGGATVAGNVSGVGGATENGNVAGAGGATVAGNVSGVGAAAVGEPVPVVRLENVVKTYSMGDSQVHALRGISFSINAGEFVSIMGPSGSGKSTCMNMIGCLDRPTSGIVEINGRDISGMNEKELAALRNRTVGFVFQQYHLIPSMNVLENVMLPLKYQRVERGERARRAQAALEAVGLSDRLRHRPHELSGGQKQRVAIARAMVTGPKILLADEPTGALDSETGLQVMDMFRQINKEEGTTVIIVTHDPRIGESTKRCIRILDGRIENQND